MSSVFFNDAYNKKEAIKASIIVCTYNREKKLSIFLNKLSNIRSLHPIEIICVDNNSTDQSRVLLDNFVRSCQLPACSVTETGKGTGYGRNTGAHLARGEYLIYIDDDCYPGEHFIDSHICVLEEDPSLGFVGGRVELFDPTDLPMTILTYKEPRYFPAHSRIRAGEVISANMCIRGKAFHEVGGWDNMFGAGTSYPCEDFDIAARLLSAGWPGIYHPSPLVYHHHERKTQADEHQLMKSYDAGRGGFYAKALITKSLRKTYIWPWIKTFYRKSPSQTAREILSFLRYFLDIKNT